MNKNTFQDKHQHHGHHHDHYHHHSHLPQNQKILLASFILISGFMLVEFVGGYLTKSLALISDAGHMLSDSVSLGIALLAVIMAQKPRTIQRSFGYLRFEILAATLNGLTLIGISLYILYEAFHRLNTPQEINVGGMMMISIIGLLINIIVAVMMFKGSDTENDLNMRGAFLHVIADLLGSLGAIIAGVCIYFFAWTWADSVASIIIAILVLSSGFQIFKQSCHILLQGTPEQFDLNKIEQDILNDTRIIKIQDVHLWTLNSTNYVFTCHVQIQQDLNLNDSQEILHNIEHYLHDIGIEHATIQIETADKAFRF